MRLTRTGRLARTLVIGGGVLAAATWVAALTPGQRLNLAAWVFLLALLAAYLRPALDDGSAR